PAGRVIGILTERRDVGENHLARIDPLKNANGGRDSGKHLPDGVERGPEKIAALIGNGGQTAEIDPPLDLVAALQPGQRIDDVQLRLRVVAVVALAKRTNASNSE